MRRTQWGISLRPSSRLRAHADACSRFTDRRCINMMILRVVHFLCEPIFAAGRPPNAFCHSLPESLSQNCAFLVANPDQRRTAIASITLAIQLRHLLMNNWIEIRRSFSRPPVPRKGKVVDPISDIVPIISLIQFLVHGLSSLASRDTLICSRANCFSTFDIHFLVLPVPAASPFIFNLI